MTLPKSSKCCLVLLALACLLAATSSMPADNTMSSSSSVSASFSSSSVSASSSVSSSSSDNGKKAPVAKTTTTTSTTTSTTTVQTPVEVVELDADKKFEQPEYQPPPQPEPEPEPKPVDDVNDNLQVNIHQVQPRNCNQSSTPWMEWGHLDDTVKSCVCWIVINRFPWALLLYKLLMPSSSSSLVVSLQDLEETKRPDLKSVDEHEATVVQEVDNNLSHQHQAAETRG